MAQKQIILITGASSGIGFDTAQALAATSTNHVIMGVRNISKGEKCLANLQSRNPQGTLSLLELDIDSDASIAAAVKTLTSDFGRLDVLINNAGISARPDPGLPRAKILEIYNTNAVGPMLLTEQLTSLLKAASNPKVINVSSLLGSVAERFDPKSTAYNSPWDAYRMSKAALNMATACQHKALGEFGCKVWAYCPGFVITNLSGEEDRQWRKDNGAESAETSAQGILEIVEGKRDAEVGTKGPGTNCLHNPKVGSRLLRIGFLQEPFV